MTNEERQLIENQARILQQLIELTNDIKEVKEMHKESYQQIHQRFDKTGEKIQEIEKDVVRIQTKSGVIGVLAGSIPSLVKIIWDGWHK